MFKKNIKPILMAGALALATAVSPVMAEKVDKVDVISTNGSFTINKTIKVADGATLPTGTISFNVIGNDSGKPVLTVPNIIVDKSKDVDSTTTDLEFETEATVSITDADGNINVIPGVYNYTVTENNTGINAGTNGTISYNVENRTYNINVYVENISEYNDDGELSGSHVGIKAITATIVGDNDNIKQTDLSFVNVYNETNASTPLTVKKVIEGRQANKQKTFDFDIDLDFPEESVGATYTYRIKNGNEVTGQISKANDGTIKAHIDAQLADNETVVFTSLPVGTKYTVTENTVSGDNYTGSLDMSNNAKVTGNDKNDNGGQIQSTASVLPSERVTATFTNTYKDTPITGVIVNNMPYIALLGASGAGLVVLAASKKRSKK